MVSFGATSPCISLALSCLAACGGVVGDAGADAGVRDATPASPDGASESRGSDAAAESGGPDAAAESGGPDAAAESGGPDAAAESGGSDAAAESGGPDAAPDAGSDGGPWTPLAIQSKLTFWFDPTSLIVVGGQVPKWTDLSSNGNNAVQATQAYEPIYTASGIAGLPSATFTGPVTFLRVTDTATMQWGTDDFLVLAVVRGNVGSAGNAMIYQKTLTPYPWDGVNLFINANEGAATNLAGVQVSHPVYALSTPPPSTFVDGSVHLLGAYRAGATLEIRVDGTVSGTMTSAQVATGDVSAIGIDAIIGQNGGGTPPTPEFQQFHGDIAEELAIVGPAASTYLANLEQYLMARYSIP
jgi:hypothetical protein